MKRVVLGFLLFMWASLALALEPYITADKVAAGDRKAVAAEVEKKLTGAGFKVIGEYYPKGLDAYGVIVVTDKGLMDAITAIGGRAIVGAGVRVGVKSDGTVSYINPEYWYRAWLRKQYPKAEAAVKALDDKLAKTLGKGKPFGGNVDADDLPDYRYMLGMERFDSKKSLLAEYPSFDDAVKTIQGNLAKGLGSTTKVYEIILPGKKLAVFGVGMSDKETGEGWWVNKIGSANIAALPWEIVVVDNKAYALYGRYRTALAWPDLGMGSFMTISSHPDATRETLTNVAGGTVPKDE